MARDTLVLDASVAVKWFSRKDETELMQALEIRDAHVSGKTGIVVPDLFYYEVVNAVAHKELFSNELVQSAVSALFALSLWIIPVEASLLASAVELSRRHSITIYDSSYIATALSRGCPLVTANPKHQGKELGCEVIALRDWRA